MYTHLAFRMRLFWYRTDREAWAFGLVIALIVVLFAFLLRGVYAYQDQRRYSALEVHRQNVHCLARNIYFEARGEPVAGQYAVAEVTMNRQASWVFPRTVCGVVYQKSAFSWTDFRSLPAPQGDDWERALNIAEAVYYQRYAPQVKGALFYHADYVQPDWAKEKKQVARIGKHLFYR